MPHCIQVWCDVCDVCVCVCVCDVCDVCVCVDLCVYTKKKKFHVSYITYTYNTYTYTHAHTYTHTHTHTHTQIGETEGVVVVDES